MINILKNGLIFVGAVCLHVVSNYFSFGVISSLGYAGKTSSILFKVFGFVLQLLWLPLGVLQYTKFWYILDWNYPAMVIMNSFVAVIIIYMLIFVKKPLWNKIFITASAIFLLWLVFAIVGIIVRVK